MGFPLFRLCLATCSTLYRYRNQYPILGLLSDDYKVTSPVNKSQTIVIERTGEIWKHVSVPGDGLFPLQSQVFNLTSKQVLPKLRAQGCPVVIELQKVK